jgi:hypothetical protein
MFSRRGFLPFSLQGFTSSLLLFSQETLLRASSISRHGNQLGRERKKRRKMNNQGVSLKRAPHVTIRVSGKLFQGHLAYLDQLVHSAADCELWSVLSLAHLEELDRAALLYLVNGEDRYFSIAACPTFIREWMDHEGGRAAA